MATTKQVISKHSSRNLNAYVQPKGNLCYTQQRLLDQTFEDPKKNYADKVSMILASWESLGAFMRKTHVEDTRNFIIDLHRCTVFVVLNTSWVSLAAAMKTHLRVSVERCASDLANRKEEESASRCRAILRLVAEPWGSNLRSVISEEPCSEADAERFINSDRLILRLRLQSLFESRILKLASQLAEFVWHWRRRRPDFFNGYLRTELNYLTDICLVLLYVLKRKKDVIIKLKELELNECYEVVQRLRAFNEEDLTSDEKRICRHAPKVAKLGVQVLLTKAMLETHSADLSNYVKAWLDLHTDMISEPPQLVEVIRKMVAHAKSIRHVVTFCKLLHISLGDSQRHLCIELYIRSLNNEMNLLEQLRTNRETSEAQDTELRLSEGFIELSRLLDSSSVRRECVLTAFSLNPTRSTLDLLSRMATVPENLDTGQPTDEVQAPESSLDATSLGLTDSLCSDLAVVLFCHRYQDLSWDVGWTELKKRCERYLESVESGARNVDPELKYLTVDYEQFKDWPDEDDGFNCIEKGYEPTSTSEEDESDGTCASEESTDYSEPEKRRIRKPKRLTDSSDDSRSDVLTKRVGRKKYTSRRGRNTYLDMSFQFRKDGKKMGRPVGNKPIGRPPLSRTKCGLRPGARPIGRPRSRLIGRTVGPPIARPLPTHRPDNRSLPIHRPIGRPLGRPPGRAALGRLTVGRSGPTPGSRPIPVPRPVPVSRHLSESIPVSVSRPMPRAVARPVVRRDSRSDDDCLDSCPLIHRSIGRPAYQRISTNESSTKLDKLRSDLDEDEVKRLLNPDKTQSDASVVKTLRSFRAPKKGVGRFAPMLSKVNLDPKVLLDPRDPEVEKYISNSKHKGGAFDSRKVLANSVPGLASLDMIVPCPQHATVQVVQISGTVPGQSTEGSTIKTEVEDECSDRLNGKTASKPESNSSSGNPPPSNPVEPATPTPTTPTSTPTVLPTSNLVTDNHLGLLRLGERLRQDSASSMQVTSTQGNESEGRDLLQMEANVRGNTAVVSSSQNWPGGPPKPENAANAIKKTEKRTGLKKQISTQTASLPQFHQAFGKQVYPGQPGESRPSSTATAAASATGSSSGSPGTASAVTAVVASPAATSGAARSGNALKQALAGGNSARLIQVPGENSLLLQAISSDNVVQQTVKLPISTATPLPEKQRPTSSMLMKQLTSPVVSHTVKAASNLLLTSTASAVIVNSSTLSSGSPVTFGANATSTPTTGSLVTKSVNTQTAVITSAQTSSPVTTPTSRPLAAQGVYLVKRKPVVQTSTGTLTTNLSAAVSGVSSSQNSTAVSLTSDEDRTHRTSMSVAFNRRVRKAPIGVQATTLKFVKPVLEERFPAPMMSLLNQTPTRPAAETPLTGGTAATSGTTSPGSRPLRQQTPPAHVTSTTLEQQLREFESVLEQVTTTSQLKERRLNPEDATPTTPPVTTASVTFSGEFSSSSSTAVEKTSELQDASPSPSVPPAAVVVTNAVTVSSPLSVSVATATPSPVVTSAVVTFSSQSGVVQTLHKLSTPIVVSTSFTQTQTVAVSSPASVTSQSSSSPSTTPSSSVPGTPSKSSKSKPKSVKTSAVQASVKTSPIAKSQKTQEDEQTTARILSILRQYDEQLRCSPDLNNKPAPRRRNNHQTHPSPNSKRKKSGSKSKPSSASDMSPSTDDTHTLGSEDSSGMASQPSGETEDETPPRASIFSAAPSPVITPAVPSTPSTSPTPSQSTSTTMCIATPTLVATNAADPPKTPVGEVKTEVETKSFSSVMPVYMVPVSSASSLPVVVSTGTQMLHVHPVGPNGAPLVGVGLGGNVQVPVVVRQIPAKQLSAVTTLEAQTANSTSEISNVTSTESRPDTILLNVTTPTRTGSTSQPVMAIMPSFHQLLTTVSTANTSTGTPTTHIRLPTTSTTTSAPLSSDTTLLSDSETPTNTRPATLLGLQLLQQQRSAKQRAQPKPAEQQPSQLQQLLSQDQPTTKQSHVFRCVMKSVKTEQEPPILLQIAKMRDDNQDSSTNQLTVQHRILKPPQPAPAAEPESPQVVLMRQTTQSVQQVEQPLQQQVLQIVQAPQPSQAQPIESEPPKLQVEPASLQTLPKPKPPTQLISQPTVQTQPVQQAIQTRPTSTTQQPLFTVHIAQRQQQLLNIRPTQKLKEQLQQTVQIQQQTHQLQLQLQQKQHMLQQRRQQTTQLAPLRQLPPPPPAPSPIESKVEPKDEPLTSQPESPTSSLKPAASPVPDTKETKEECPSPTPQPSSPQRTTPSPTLTPTPNRNTSVPEGENTNESSGDSPASSNTIHMPSSGIDGDTSPERSPGGPISCWRYTESRGDRDRVKLTAKLPARTPPTISKAANKRKPTHNMYPCSLSKSLSEECEDLGVDRPSTRELFPDTDLFLDSNNSPSYTNTDSPSNSQDAVSTSPEPPDKKKKYPVVRSFPSQKSDISFLCGSESKVDERKQNGEPVSKPSEVPIDSITAGVALASEVTAASPLPNYPNLSSVTSNREDASSPDASMVFMHQGRVTTYGRRRDSRPIRDEWESEPLRSVPSSDVDDDFWREPLVDDKEDVCESLPVCDLDGHCPSPASNGTDLVRVAAAAAVAAVVAKPITTTSMTTRRGALKRKDANDPVKRDLDKKTEKKVRRTVVQEEEEEKRGSALRSKRTVMNRTEVFPRDTKKKVPEEGSWRETTVTPTVTVRRTSLRARVPGQPGSPAPSASVESASAPSPSNKSVTKLDRKRSKGKPVKGVAQKKK